MNLKAVEERYLNDAVFHHAVDAAALQAVQAVAEQRGEPLLAGFRQHQISVARQAILTFVAITGQNLPVLHHHAGG